MGLQWLIWTSKSVRRFHFSERCLRFDAVGCTLCGGPRKFVIDLTNLSCGGNPKYFTAVIIFTKCLTVFVVMRHPWKVIFPFRLKQLYPFHHMEILSSNIRFVLLRVSEVEAFVEFEVKQNFSMAQNQLQSSATSPKHSSDSHR